MSEQPASFRHLIAPVSPETFFTTFLAQRPAHFPGPEARFDSLFSWSAVNRLLEQSKLWTERTLKVVLDGRDVAPPEYCRSGVSREGHAAMLVDPEAVSRLLERGATVVLDLVETLDPGVREVAGSLQASLGGAVVCNVYCSWRAHQGFPSHYDTTDVVVLHIAGRKRWRLYQGRAEHPVGVAGYDFASFSPEHHERMKGAVLDELEMTPGDVLYIPRGQYHDALAESDASLHLSFGITYATGLDLFGLLRQSLPEEALFRASLPHFDDARGHHHHLVGLADRLREVLSAPGMSEQIRAWQEERAVRDGLSRFVLPARASTRTYRVMALGVILDRAADPVVLECRGERLALDAGRVASVEWILGRDWFRSGDLPPAGGGSVEASPDALLGDLERIGLIKRLFAPGNG